MLNLFKFLSIFDWISPTTAILEDVVEGGPLNFSVWTFFIPFDEAIRNGWSTFGIREVLAKNGVKSWGGLLSGEEFFFKVKLEQARWAEYVLLNNNIPVDQRSSSPPRLEPKKNRLSRQKRSKADHDPLSFLNDFLEGDLPPFFG